MSDAPLRQRTREAIPAPHPQRLTLVSDRETETVLASARSEAMHSNWNVPFWRRFDGELDLVALETALRRLLERQEALRGAYAVDGDRVVRVVGGAGDLVIQRTNLGGVPADRRLGDAHTLLWQDLRAPLDLSRPPLLRARLITLGGDSHILGLAISHLVCDRWSTPILARELWELYHATVEGRPSRLAPLPVPLFDYLAWRRKDAPGIFAEHERRVRASLAGSRLPVRFAPPAQVKPTEDEQHGLVTASLSAATVQALRNLCQTLRVSMFMVHLAALGALVHRMTGTPRIVVQTQVANRLRRELRDVVGCLYNVVRVPLDFEGDPTVTELLARVRESALESFVHQEWECDTFRFRSDDAKHANTASVRLVYRTADDERGVNGVLKSDRLRMSGFGEIPFASNGELALGVMESATGEVRCHFSWKPSAFDDGVMQRMVAHHGRLIADIAASPERRVSELELLGAAERASLTGRGVLPGEASRSSSAEFAVSPRATVRFGTTAWDAAGLIREVAAVQQAAPAPDDPLSALVAACAAYEAGGRDGSADSLAFHLRSELAAQVRASDTVLCGLPATSETSMVLGLTSLRRGASLVLVPGVALDSAHRMAALIRAHRPTIAAVRASVAASLLAGDAGDLRGLRLVVVSGSLGIDVDLAERPPVETWVLHTSATGPDLSCLVGVEKLGRTRRGLVPFVPGRHRVVAGPASMLVPAGVLGDVVLVDREPIHRTGLRGRVIDDGRLEILPPPMPAARTARPPIDLSLFGTRERRLVDAVFER